MKTGTPLDQLFNLALVLGIVLLIVTACGGDAPTPAPTRAPATAPASPQSAATNPAPAPTNAPSNGSGQLPADPEKALYNFEVIPQETEVSYSVFEILFDQPRMTVGKTNKVEGKFTLGLRAGVPYFDVNQLRVDLRTLKSDNDMRDGTLQRRWLESARYPWAEFVAKEVVNFPNDAALGKEAKFQVKGDMTVREITKPATFDVVATFDGEKLTGVGTTYLLMKDYGFDPPEILGRFRVSDGVTITVKSAAKLLDVKPLQ